MEYAMDIGQTCLPEAKFQEAASHWHRCQKENDDSCSGLLHPLLIERSGSAEPLPSIIL